MTRWLHSKLWAGCYREAQRHLFQCFRSCFGIPRPRYRTCVTSCTVDLCTSPQAWAMHGQYKQIHSISIYISCISLYHIYMYIYINFYHHNFMNVAYVMHCGVTIVSKQTYVRRGAPTCYNTLISCHGPIVLNIAFHGPHGIPSGIPDPLIPLGVHSLAR